MSQISNKVKDIIMDLSKDKNVKRNHIIDVVKHSVLLAKKLKADEEICELSAWLHDIDKLKGGKEGHHIRGSKDAETILRKLNYPTDKIKKVSYCILTHSSDKTYPPRTLEAKVLASADGLAHFDIFLEIIYYYAKKADKSVDETIIIEDIRQGILRKAKSSYDKMMPCVKKMVKKKHDALKVLLKK